MNSSWSIPNRASKSLPTKSLSTADIHTFSFGPSRTFFEEVYDSSRELLVEDTYPTIEGLKNTLEIQASLDPKAAKAKAEDFVDLRFVDELKKSGFIEKLYGKR